MRFNPVSPHYGSFYGAQLMCSAIIDKIFPNLSGGRNEACYTISCRCVFGIMWT